MKMDPAMVVAWSAMAVAVIGALGGVVVSIINALATRGVKADVATVKENVASVKENVLAVHAAVDGSATELKATNERALAEAIRVSTDRAAELKAVTERAVNEAFRVATEKAVEALARGRAEGQMLQHQTAPPTVAAAPLVPPDSKVIAFVAATEPEKPAA